MLLKSYPTIITHSVSAGALLCDSTEENAFIAPTGIDFTPYRGKQIEIWSGSTLWARAWVSGTAPTGDGAGAELLDANIFTTFDFTSGWSTTGSATITDSDTFATPIAYEGIYKSNAITQGVLYKASFTGTPSAGQSILQYGGVGPSMYNGADVYTTVKSLDNHLYLINTAIAVSVDVSTLVVQRVLDPAPTGALLLSSNGGSRGWAYKHASFNPNAAVTLRILARRIASGNGGYYK